MKWPPIRVANDAIRWSGDNHLWLQTTGATTTGLRCADVEQPSSACLTPVKCQRGRYILGRLMGPVHRLRLIRTSIWTVARTFSNVQD